MATKYTGPVRKRTGIVFAPGKYPDKGIEEVTEEDIRQIAAASNERVAFDSEHGPSLFDGLLGEGYNFRAAPDDAGRTVLWADWDQPEPLAQLMGETTPTVSAAFDDWKSRKVAKIALAKFPRVPDAKFFSAVTNAYVAFSSNQPVEPINFSFYTAAEQGAIDAADCGDPTNKLFPARTEDELRESIRQLWNAENPTEVKTNLLAIAERKKFRLPGEVYWWPSPEAGVSAPLPVGQERPYWFSTNPVETREGEGYNRPQNSPEGEKTKHMENNSNSNQQPSMWDKLAALAGFTPEQKTKLEAQFNAKTPREIELEAENARLQQQISAGNNSPQFSAQQRELLAQQATDTMLKDKRILPHQVDSVKADFSRALADDAANPNKVTFSAMVQGQAVEVQVSRFDSLKQLYSALPQHQLENEVTKEFAPETVALFNREATALRTSAPGGDGQVDGAAYEQMMGKKLS